MPENEVDPAGTTQQFRAFVQKGEGGSVEPPKSNLGLIIVVAAIVVALVLVAAFFMM